MAECDVHNIRRRWDQGQFTHELIYGPRGSNIEPCTVGEVDTSSLLPPIWNQYNEFRGITVASMTRSALFTSLVPLTNITLELPGLPFLAPPSFWCVEAKQRKSQKSQETRESGEKR